MDISQISALADLIKSSVDNIAHDEQDRLAALKIVAAASQLVALVRPPEQSLMEAATAFHLSSALRLVVEAHIAEIIREAGPHGAHVRHIALHSGIDPSKLAHVLRLLATHHIFTELAPDVFAHSRVSQPLDTRVAVSDAKARPADKFSGKHGGVPALIGLTTDESMRASLALTDTLLDPESGPSAHPRHAPFSRAWHTQQTMFEWLAEPAHTPRLVRFGNAMAGISGMTPPDAILRGFDWAALPAGSTVIDVGGGVGAASLPIVQHCPTLKLIIQDTASQVAQAPTFWEQHAADALASGRVSFEAHDFFAPQPAHAARAAAFLLRMIMHNWPDAESALILRRLRAAAAPAARLVIVDSILLPACRAPPPPSPPADADVGVNGAAAGEAPAPLLANWGVANGLAYKLDLQMLCNHNAGERTLAQFAALLARTGWAVRAVHQFHESWMPQIVAVPAPLPEGAGAGAGSA